MSYYINNTMSIGSDPFAPFTPSCDGMSTTIFRYQNC